MRALLALFLVLIHAATAAAQDARAALITPNESAPSWGVASQAIATSSAFFFQVTDGGPLGTFQNAYRYKFDDKPVVASFSSLPAGALITAVEIEGCDTSSTDEIVFEAAHLTATGLVSLDQSATTGLAATPGCGFFNYQLLAPHTVSQANAYVVVLHTQGTTSARYSTARLVYKLQLSPAPATSTFVDVPVGAPFHRFVEALAASGITSGCGGGNFCPDIPVSRAQLAVFLSVALGLHFPNQ